jgi:hypothetical protein
MITVGEIGASSTETNFAALFPAAATLDQLFVYLDNNGSATDTFTVYVNNAATSLACTMTNQGRCSNTSTTATIPAGGGTFTLRMATAPGQPVHFRVRVQ